MSDSLPVVVIGNGIIGQCIALGIAQAGQDVVLVAPHKPPEQPLNGSPWGDRIYAISPQSQALLQQLHIWPALNPSRYQAVTSMSIHGDAGGFFQLNKTVSQNCLSVIVESNHLEATLTHAIHFNPHIEQRVGQVTDCNFLPSHVDIQLNQQETLQASCVFACDGRSSSIRQMAGIDIWSHDYNEVAIVANFKATKPHHSAARQWFLGHSSDIHQQGIIALLPLPDNHLSLVWSCQTSHAQSLLKLSDTDFTRTLLHANMGQIRDATGQLSLQNLPQGFSLKASIAHRLIGNRLVLMGDSAHVVHPLAGQGVNLGLRDVKSFIDIMQQHPFDWDSPQLLRRYERTRWADILAIQGTTFGLNTLFRQTGAPFQRLRNFGMSLLEKTPFLKQQISQHATDSL